MAKDFLKEDSKGIPWRSNGLDSALPLQGAQVQSLVGELRSHELHSVAQKNKEEEEEEDSKDQNPKGKDEQI